MSLLLEVHKAREAFRQQYHDATALPDPHRYTPAEPSTLFVDSHTFADFMMNAHPRDSHEFAANGTICGLVVFVGSRRDIGGPCNGRYVHVSGPVKYL